MQKLKKLIKNTRIISFDIFDTTIVRNVCQPKDVFKIVEKKFIKLFENKFYGYYPQIRIESEIKARALNEKLGFDEPDYYEIFRILQNKCSLTDNEIGFLKETEEKVELNICVKNKPIWDIYKYCLRLNRTIIFNSDMYLPIDIISAILKKSGYGTFQRIFVSSNTGKSKLTGRAYWNILHELGCKSSEILHIGDNKESDIKKAKECGIVTYYYERPLVKAKKCKDFISICIKPLKNSNDEIYSSIYKAIIINKFYAGSNKKIFWYELGFKIGGFLVSNYVFWLLNKFRDHNIDAVLLFSRDGYIIKKLLDILKNDNIKLPKYKYFYSSRWFFFKASVSENTVVADKKNLLFYISLNQNDLNERLESLGVDPDKCINEILEFNNILNSKDLYSEKEKKLINCSLIEKILSNLKNSEIIEKKQLENYLKKTNYHNEEKIAIVDALGHGTCQFYLLKFLNSIKTNINEIYGYYLGTYISQDKKEKYPGLNQNSFLFTFNSYDCTKVPIRDVYLYELFFTAPHGSFVKFNDEIELKPIFDNDNDDNKIAITKSIHNGIIDFFKEFKEAVKVLDVPYADPDTIIRITSRLARSPNYNEAKNIGNVKVIDSNSDSNFFIAKPSCFNIFLKRSNIGNPWYEGFIKRKLIKIPFFHSLNRKSINDIIFNRKFRRNFLNLFEKYQYDDLYFYGAGTFAISMNYHFDLSIFDICGFFDKDISKEGKHIAGKPIYNSKQIPNMKPDVIVITMHNPYPIVPYLKDIKDQYKLNFDIVTLL